MSISNLCKKQKKGFEKTQRNSGKFLVIKGIFLTQRVATLKQFFISSDEVLSRYKNLSFTDFFKLFNFGKKKHM